MMTLSVRQPWAWLILRPDIQGEQLRRDMAGSGYFRDVENRPFPTSHVGRLYIYAAPGTREEFEQAARFAADRGIEELPEIDQVDSGGLVGHVRLTGCARHSPSRWFVGPWGWLLREPVVQELRPCAAGAGIFDAEPLLRRARIAEQFKGKD